MSFYIQSGYKGKEVGALMVSVPQGWQKFSKVSKFKKGDIPVGTVEFVESFIGIQEPNYYPLFLKDYFHREVWWSHGVTDFSHFYKPADRHKRFDGQIVTKDDICKPDFDVSGPVWISEIIRFKEEWRYYVANGEILAAYWYDGLEEEVGPPTLDIDWPEDFCGAVDFGRTTGGLLALVENNLPYACGWYGPYNEGGVYAEWLEKGFDFIEKGLNIKL